MKYERKQLIKEVEKYEGFVNHMYLDTKGYVTVGYGNLLQSMDEAKKVNFIHKGSKDRVDDIAVKSDWCAVLKLMPNRHHSVYKKHVNLIVEKKEAKRLLEEKISSFEKELGNIFLSFKFLPDNIKYALFDMIYNLGATTLRLRFPKFCEAIKNKEWQIAAHESSRRDVSDARNEYVKELILRSCS